MLPRVVRLYVCTGMCVFRLTLLHPAKVVGRNEMPFCIDSDKSRIVPSNIVSDRDFGPLREREIWGRNPQFAAIHDHFSGKPEMSLRQGQGWQKS